MDMCMFVTVKTIRLLCSEIIYFVQCWYNLVLHMKLMIEFVYGKQKHHDTYTYHAESINKAI